MLRSRVHSAANLRKVTGVPPIDLARVQVILLDIEGTTTPVGFVYRTLFPYARHNLRAFLRENANDLKVREAVAALRSHHDGEFRAGKLPPPWIADSDESAVASAAEYGLWLMDQDSKIGPLKFLQGLIWQKAYQAGRLKGQVYADVPVAFKRWTQQGKKIAIYSSGSELAQKLLFGATEHGDLTHHITAFFDTRVGAKADVASYRQIAAILGVPEDRFLFLSDTIAELNAARSADMSTALVVREGTSEGPSQGQPVIHDFDLLT
jgi:enolase-phosphatase E1